jgi:hypothetical protein
MFASGSPDAYLRLCVVTFFRPAREDRRSGEETMTLATAIYAWLALNYLIMARLAYVALRRDGGSGAESALRALLWPTALLTRRRA